VSISAARTYRKLQNKNGNKETEKKIRAEEGEGRTKCIFYVISICLLLKSSITNVFIPLLK
jgi:hypothetical protein